MFELLGGVIGAVARMLPEVLTFFDKKNERKHELSMFDKQIEMDKIRSQLKNEEVRVQGDVASDLSLLQSYQEAIKAQGQLTGFKWADVLNQLVRPVLTYYWAILLYSVSIVAQYILLTQTGIPGVEAINAVFGQEEKALVYMMISFFFVGRVLDKGKK